MALTATVKVEGVLNDFAEIMSGLMIDQYQQQVAELDLTLTQAQMLRILRRGPLTTGQLAEKLGISAPAITQLTDRLLRKELIERRAADDDRRCVIVALSARGVRLVDQFRKRRSAVFSDALAQLSDDDQKQAVEILGKVVKALETHQTITNLKQPEGNGSAAKKQKS